MLQQSCCFWNDNIGHWLSTHSVVQVWCCNSDYPVFLLRIKTVCSVLLTPHLHQEGDNFCTSTLLLNFFFFFSLILNYFEGFWCILSSLYTFYPIFSSLCSMKWTFLRTFGCVGKYESKQVIIQETYIGYIITAVLHSVQDYCRVTKQCVCHPCVSAFCFCVRYSMCTHPIHLLMFFSTCFHKEIRQSNHRLPSAAHFFSISCFLHESTLSLYAEYNESITTAVHLAIDMRFIMMAYILSWHIKTSFSEHDYSFLLPTGSCSYSVLQTYGVSYYFIK